MSGDPRDEKIAYIGVSHSELRDTEYSELEDRIDANLAPYFGGIDHMSREDLELLRDAVKETRKQSFRFTDTDDIEKIRIQLALSRLARLFRLAGDKLAAKSTRN